MVTIMKKTKKIISLITAALVIGVSLPGTAQAAVKTSDSSKMYTNSDFVEKEQPELNQETKKLIAQYQKETTLDNYLKLRDMVIQNYNAVLDRKEAKLQELIEETAGKPGADEKVAEMEEIVQDMYIQLVVHLH